MRKGTGTGAEKSVSTAITSELPHPAWDPAATDRDRSPEETANGEEDRGIPRWSRSTFPISVASDSAHPPIRAFSIR